MLIRLCFIFSGAKLQNNLGNIQIFSHKIQSSGKACHYVTKNWFSATNCHIY